MGRRGLSRRKARRGEATESEVRKSILERFFLRFHMSLILGAVVLVGLLASKALLGLGVTSMPLRYPLAVLVSYAIFFACVRAWIWYVTPAYRPALEIGMDFDLGGGAGDLLDSVASLPGKGASAGADQAFRMGGGGDFGGGGASDSWSAPSPSGGASGGVRLGLGSSGGSWAGSGGSGGSWFDFDLGDDAGVVVVLIAFAVLLAVIFGAGIYLVYQAPVIIVEAAFEVVLASGLVKASRKMDRLGWMGSVFKSTWIPLAIVLVTTVVFALIAEGICPEATKIADVLRGCGTEAP